MTLSEFQSLKGIPKEDQILLIGNPRFEKFIQSSIRLSEKSRFQLNIDAFFKFRKKSGIDLFYGSTSNSVNSLEHLKKVIDVFSNFDSIRVVLGKGDYEINKDFADLIPNNCRILGNNINVSDHRFEYLPMGRDFRSFYFSKHLKPEKKKQNLVYANFSTNTHPNRKELARRISGMKMIKMEHMGDFLKYNISREQFFKNLSESKFSICPRGNAIDTFRLWDSLYVGTIPVVIKEAVFHELLSDLPILFVDSYDDFLNLSNSHIEDIYEDMQSQHYNWDKLTLSNWLRGLN